MNLPAATSRVIIQRVTPTLDGGRFPIRRVVGEKVFVEAEIFADGHDTLDAMLLVCEPNCQHPIEVPMTEVSPDHWRGTVIVRELGVYSYTVGARVNPFLSWWNLVERKRQSGMSCSDEIDVAIAFLDQAISRTDSRNTNELRQWKERALSAKDFLEELRDGEARGQLNALLNRSSNLSKLTTNGQKLKVAVDPALARFSAWYEVFPRSCATQPGKHGTLRDLADRLPLIADMGFSVLYLPPIHPIGQTARKGRNNSLTAGMEDPGSVWAIGSPLGGHDAVHPLLGTLDDLCALLGQARAHGLEIALDIALQCSPDHPYLTAHPDWFARLPNGKIRYAENPPYRYEDVLPLNFECADWRRLWNELKRVFAFWGERGFRVFRVDNPHTKPFCFWEWLINELRESWPDVVFLSEGLARPTVMTHLAKVGFSQSYDHFPWQESKKEITDYYVSLTKTRLRDFFRPVLWPNTPQLLPRVLQNAPPQTFAIRFLLAATLGSSYGIYGPAFELCENRPAAHDSVDYIDSEQYEIKCWDWLPEAGVRPLIKRVNLIRKHNAALQSNDNLVFHEIDNERLIAYSKTASGGSNAILMVVNLDADHTQSGWTNLNLAAFGLSADSHFVVEDLLDGSRYHWRGARNYCEFNPALRVAHLFRLTVVGA